MTSEYIVYPNFALVKIEVWKNTSVNLWKIHLNFDFFVKDCFLTIESFDIFKFGNFLQFKVVRFMWFFF